MSRLIKEQNTIPRDMSTQAGDASSEKVGLRLFVPKEYVRNEKHVELECHDPAPIFHFPPPPQTTTTTPPPPVTQPARAQQAPVRRQSPANIPLPPSPPPMDICPPSPPRPTLAHLMPQSDVPSLADC